MSGLPFTPPFLVSYPSTMDYVLCVATDFDGAKINLQFDFPQGAPTVADVLNTASATFGNLFRTKGVMRPFSITTAVIFNETHLTWDRLERSSQLVHNGQLYLFQPDLVDLPGDIPDPIPAQDYVDSYVPPQPSTLSPVRTYSGVDGVNHTPYRYVSEPSPVRPAASYVSSPPRSALDESAEMIRAFHRRRETPGALEDDGPSIIQDERRRLSEQARLSLDEYRTFARREAHEFSPERSPGR